MQDVIDRAVKIATKAAMLGNPVERIVWQPPASPTQNRLGTFVIKAYEPKSATQRAPWD